jgi:prepilin-type N-terminal cleavage/methylation domain-containing protein
VQSAQEGCRLRDLISARYGLLQAPARCTPAGACFLGVGVHALNSEITFPRRAVRSIFRGVNQGRKAFTLIELLAVVAIVLILLGLLAPLFSRIIDQGRFLVCMSNVRQITSANVLYANDNEGSLVGPNWVPTGDPPAERGWLTGTNRHLFFGPEAIRSGLLFPYVSDVALFRCPADPQAGARARAIYYPDDTRMLTSYIMNGSVCGYGSRPYDTVTRLWTTYKVSQFKGSDFIFWEGDENLNSYGDWWDGANTPNQGISGRHLGDNMVGCVDGHGERLTRAEYYAMVYTNGRTRLYNVPDRPSGGNPRP